MKKLSAILSIAIILVSTLAFLWMPASASTVMHTASVSPTVTTVPEVKYVFNVTNLSNASELINVVNITFPEGFKHVSNEPPSDWGANIESWPTIKFSNTTGPGLGVDASALFNVTVLWPAVPARPTTATFEVNCFSGTDASVTPVKLSVSFNPQFTATIDKTHVKGNTSYLFNITTVNAASDIGLGTINITYPSGWTFNALKDYGGSRTWSAVHDSAANTFKLTGPNLLVGEYVWIQVNMTTPSTTEEPGHWNSTAFDIGVAFLGTYDLPVIVDAVPPTVTINNPAVDYYTVGSGNHIWINATVNDDLNITKYGMNVTINDARFQQLVTPEKGASDKEYKYYYGNITAIPDGPLAVEISAMDKAGNVNGTEASTTIDNTAPRKLWVKVLDQGDNELPFVNGVYWMGSETTGIKVNASFYNPSGISGGYIYLDETSEAFVNGTAVPATPFNVTGSDYVNLTITLIDGASPTPNNFTQTWEIKRDKVKPSTPTFTVQPISGGAIIRDLNATDNVGVLSYNVYINGTPVEILVDDLNAAIFTPINSHVTFSGILVLNLTGYAGKVANITIATVDYGANEGNSTSKIISVPEGTWYPIELFEGWNLISLPLIPANASRIAVLSLILKQGIDGVTIVYEYDQNLDSWIVNPTTMTDGKGYWVYMKDYDVIIVSGSIMPPGGGMPPTYTLTKGWVLAGFKSVEPMVVADYLASVRNASYFRILYVWNAEKQAWYILDKDNPEHQLYPGQGFWIYMYEEEVLIPPLPPP